MKILQVIPYFSPQMGGSAQAAYQIAKNLGLKGHAVTVLAGDFAQRRARFPEGPFELVLLPGLFGRQGFYITPDISSWARNNLSAFDIFHLHISRSYQNVVLAPLADRLGVPFVLSAHGTLPRIDRLKLAKRAFDWVFGGRVYARARRWAAVTPLEAEQYRKAGIPEERIRIIGNGLDLEEFENLPAWGRFRGAHPGIGKDAKLLLAVSRLHKIKGLDFLIEGFSRLPPSPEGFRLAIVGPDEGERSRLRRLSEALGVADSVIFTGPLYSRDRLEAFVDADLFLSTSRYEITGLTSFEALMCGVPVIVTKESGQGRLIDASRAGYLVPFGDVHALTSAVRTALADKEDAARRVRAGQEYVRREMDWRLITDSWVALYREVVADSEAAGKGKDPAQGEADHPG